MNYEAFFIYKMWKCRLQQALGDAIRVYNVNFYFKETKSSQYIPGVTFSDRSRHSRGGKICYQKQFKDNYSNYDKYFNTIPCWCPSLNVLISFHVCATQ